MNVAVLILSCESLFAVAIGNKLGFLKQFRNSLGRDNSSVAISGSPFVISSARCESYAEMLKARQPRSPKRETIVKYGTNFFIGCLYTTVIKVMNRLTVVRREELYSQVFGRDKGKGLLTYSNHQSMVDDPGLWVALLPWWRMPPEQFRWGLCTQDVFFASPIITAIMRAGNIIPLNRSDSIDQPLLKRFYEKLREGYWCHIFPEGRVWQNWRFQKDEPILGKFKAGIGKVIAHSYPNDPIVLPVYHTGFDGVIPEKILPSAEGNQLPSSPKSAIPQGGNQLRVFVGQPMSFHKKIKAFAEKYPSELLSWDTTLPKIHLYREITEELRHGMLCLEQEAYQRSRAPPLKPSVWPRCEVISSKNSK